MSVYAIGDLHLSFTTHKPMDVFGSVWQGHEEKIRQNWFLTEDDTCVITGDSSWGIDLEEALEDLQFINGLPGKKIILRGNHDYWWETMKKMNAFKQTHGLDTVSFLFNNHYVADGICICGTRGWIRESGVPEDEKIIKREVGRLKLSLESGIKENPNVTPYVFLHYPPLFSEERCAPIMDVLHEYGIKKLYYGHLHGTNSHRNAVIGEKEGIEMVLVSCDYTDFKPITVV